MPVAGVSWGCSSGGGRVLWRGVDLRVERRGGTRGVRGVGGHSRRRCTCVACRRPRVCRPPPPRHARTPSPPSTLEMLEEEKRSCGGSQEGDAARTKSTAPLPPWVHIQTEEPHLGRRVPLGCAVGGSGGPRPHAAALQHRRRGRRTREGAAGGPLEQLLGEHEVNDDGQLTRNR